jgi:hypothetical protein
MAGMTARQVDREGPLPFGVRYLPQRLVRADDTGAVDENVDSPDLGDSRFDGRGVADI